MKRNGVELVIAHHGDRIAREHHGPHNVQGLADLRAAVYEIAHKGHLPFVGVLVHAKLSYISQLAKQYFKCIGMPVNISNNIKCHAANVNNPLADDLRYKILPGGIQAFLSWLDEAEGICLKPYLVEFSTVN